MDVVSAFRRCWSTAGWWSRWRRRRGRCGSGARGMWAGRWWNTRVPEESSPFEYTPSAEDADVDLDEPCALCAGTDEEGFYFCDLCDKGFHRACLVSMAGYAEAALPREALGHAPTIAPENTDDSRRPGFPPCGMGRLPRMQLTE